MTEQLYIWIPNWEKFQHYTNRDPIWIKNYTRLLSHDAYLSLSFAQRGLLHGIWLEYAKSTQRLPGDTSKLSQRVGRKVRKETLAALVHAGFIELVASSVLATRYQVASTEQKRVPPLTPPQKRGGEGITKTELRRYTGCRMTRGTHGTGFKHDPLGTDRPPADWPHDKPTLDEVLAARARRAT